MNFLSTANTTANRRSQLSGGGASTGIYQGLIDSVGAEAQSAKAKYAGGESSMVLPMPFESTNAWIRSIPDTGAVALLCTRADTSEVAFLRYLNTNATERLGQFKEGLGVYRPLLPGEHEVHSSGLAQSFYAARPLLEQRGGAISLWLDQDRAEAGSKAPFHTRQLWEHKSNLIGDEERFGVVKRPLELSLANIPVLGVQTLLETGEFSTTSFNVSQYPIPNFTMPAGAPATFGALAEAAAKISETLSMTTGVFKSRPFGKEYLRVIKNPLPGVNIVAPKLIDIREGHVFHDTKIPLDGTLVGPNGQIIGFNGAYLRARYQYFDSLGTNTSCEIDDLGAIFWKLSPNALNGWSMLLPTGPFKVKALLQGINFWTGLTFDSFSTAATSITSVANMSLTSQLAQQSLSSFAGTSISTKANLNTSSLVNTTLEAKGLFTAKAGALWSGESLVKAQLKAPLVDIGPSPVTPAVCGTELKAWLLPLLQAFVTAVPTFAMGNLGYPCPMDPKLAAAIATAITGLSAKAGQPVWASATVKVSP